MTVQLLTEYHLEFLSIKEAVQARLRLHLSKFHIVGNHMSRLSFHSYKNIQCSFFITHCLGSIGMDCVITETCYKGTILQKNYRKMTIP